MKVKELIKALSKMPQDAEVFGHSAMDEGDHGISKVCLCHKDDEYEYSMKEYYCQADSVARMFLDDNPNEKHVVVLGESIYAEDEE